MQIERDRIDRNMPIPGDPEGRTYRNMTVQGWIVHGIVPPDTDINLNDEAYEIVQWTIKKRNELLDMMRELRHELSGRGKLVNR